MQILYALLFGWYTRYCSCITKKGCQIKQDHTRLLIQLNNYCLKNYTPSKKYTFTKRLRLLKRKNYRKQGASLSQQTRIHLHRGLLSFVATSFEMPKSLHEEGGPDLWIPFSGSYSNWILFWTK